MSDKVEFNGKVYEIGKYYMFGSAHIARLRHIKKNDFVANDSSCWDNIRAIEITGTDANLFGTIEDAPFKPEFHKLYEFSDFGGAYFIAEFLKMDGKSFVTVQGKVCTDCRPVPADQRAEYGD
jgi:hypothetical protein